MTSLDVEVARVLGIPPRPFSSDWNDFFNHVRPWLVQHERWGVANSTVNGTLRRHTCS